MKDHNCLLPDISFRLYRCTIFSDIFKRLRTINVDILTNYYTIVCDGFEDGPAKEYADKSYTIDVRDTDALLQSPVSPRG